MKVINVKEFCKLIKDIDLNQYSTVSSVIENKFNNVENIAQYSNEELATKQFSKTTGYKKIDIYDKQFSFYENDSKLLVVDGDEIVNVYTKSFSNDDNVHPNNPEWKGKSIEELYLYYKDKADAGDEDAAFQLMELESTYGRSIRSFSVVNGDSPAFKAGKAYAEQNPGKGTEEIRLQAEAQGYKEDEVTNFIFGYNCVDKSKQLVEKQTGTEANSKIIPAENVKVQSKLDMDFKWNDNKHLVESYPKSKCKIVINLFNSGRKIIQTPNGLFGLIQEKEVDENSENYKVYDASRLPVFIDILEDDWGYKGISSDKEFASALDRYSKTGKDQDVTSMSKSDTIEINAKQFSSQQSKAYIDSLVGKVITNKENGIKYNIKRVENINSDDPRLILEYNGMGSAIHYSNLLDGSYVIECVNQNSNKGKVRNIRSFSKGTKQFSITTPDTSEFTAKDWAIIWYCLKTCSNVPFDEADVETIANVISDNGKNSKEFYLEAKQHSVQEKHMNIRSFSKGTKQFSKTAKVDGKTVKLYSIDELEPGKNYWLIAEDTEFACLIKAPRKNDKTVKVIKASEQFWEDQPDGELEMEALTEDPVEFVDENVGPILDNGYELQSYDEDYYVKQSSKHLAY